MQEELDAEVIWTRRMKTSSCRFNGCGAGGDASGGQCSRLQVTAPREGGHAPVRRFFRSHFSPTSRQATHIAAALLRARFLGEVAPALVHTKAHVPMTVTGRVDKLQATSEQYGWSGRLLVETRRECARSLVLRSCNA
jgi:hypothetical protein